MAGVTCGVGPSQIASAPCPNQWPGDAVVVAALAISGVVIFAVVVAFAFVLLATDFNFFFSCGMRAAIMRFHSSLSWAIAIMSCSGRWHGTSMNRFPSLPISYCLTAARYSMRFGPILNICPSHLALVRRIAATKSKVLVLLFVSS